MSGGATGAWRGKRWVRAAINLPLQFASPGLYCCYACHNTIPTGPLMTGINSMPLRLLRGLIAGCCLILLGVGALANSEFNPVARHPVPLGPEAQRLIVGFRATANNQVVKTIHRAKAVKVIQIGRASCRERV